MFVSCWLTFPCFPVHPSCKANERLGRKANSCKHKCINAVVIPGRAIPLHVVHSVCVCVQLYVWQECAKNNKQHLCKQFSHLAVSQNNPCSRVRNDGAKPRVPSTHRPTVIRWLVLEVQRKELVRTRRSPAKQLVKSITIKSWFAISDGKVVELTGLHFRGWGWSLDLKFVFLFNGRSNYSWSSLIWKCLIFKNI